MSSRLVDRLKGAAQRLGGGGARAPSTHEDPLEAPSVGRGVVIAPEHPDPAWPTPNYVERLQRRIDRLRGDHAELYDEWRSFMQDYIATVPMVGDQVDATDRELKHRQARERLSPFLRKHRGVLEDDPEDPPES